MLVYATTPPCVEAMALGRFALRCTGKFKKVQLPPSSVLLYKPLSVLKYIIPGLWVSRANFMNVCTVPELVVKKDELTSPVRAIVMNVQLLPPSVLFAKPLL